MVRTKEILELSKLESDRLHIEVLRSKHDILNSLGKLPDPKEVERIWQYEKESAALAIAVAVEETQVGIANYVHAIFALGVTLLSIAITLSGMAIISDRQVLWHVGIVLGAVGCGLVGWGIFRFV